MTDPFLLRLAAAPARTVAVVLSALLLLLVVLASLPALLLLSATTRGQRRTDRLVHQITAWTATVLTGPAGRAPTAAKPR
ncbi:hypothetical protein ACWGKU_28810 [Kitasatospora sp. NPDC054768]